MRILLLLLIATLLAACQPDAPSRVDGGPVFPTVTAGRVLQGDLGPPLAFGAAEVNPATVVAQANPPTPTPNFAACPPQNTALQLEAGVPGSAQALAEAMAAFLSAGGTADNLHAGLRDRWRLINDSEAGGMVRSDLDLTGEGAPEVIVSLITPDLGGVLFIFACLDGQISARYVGLPEDGMRGEPPRLLNTADLNADGRPDLVITSRACDEDDTCYYRTQIAGYDALRGRFRNLLEGAVRTEELPRLEDIDADRVTELIVPMSGDGDAGTGPLRTGQIVYDWNGFAWVRSFTELDPPRFRIQVVQAADAAFAAGNYPEAGQLFEQAFSDDALENWFNDDAGTLRAYALYRLLVLYSFTGDDRLVETQARLLQSYPDLAAAPVYAELAQGYWSAYQASNNLASACAEVQAIIAARPEAVELLNRYGGRSPMMTAAALCGF